MTLPTPYYDRDGITIYCADCRDVLPYLDAPYVVVTDQPYGTGWVRGGEGVGEFKPRHEKPGWDIWSLDWLEYVGKADRIAAFCPVGKTEELSNALPYPAVLYYRKSNPRPGGHDREPIVCSPPPTVDSSWSKLAYNSAGSPFHPCQKPIDVMQWLVSLVADDGQKVVDPFMGSGTTLVAAKLAGCRAIGIELEERYCEIAVKRLRQKTIAWEATPA